MPDKDHARLHSMRSGIGTRGRLREGFRSFDLNGDGRLTLGEFIRFMHSVDDEITTEECETGFSEIDANADGAVDFDEFLAWWTSR